MRQDSKECSSHHTDLQIEIIKRYTTNQPCFSTFFFLLGNVQNSSTVDPQAIEEVVSLQGFGYFMGFVAGKTQTANSGESTNTGSSHYSHK